MAQTRPLSKREREAVELLLQGKSNKLIASSLGITQRTVEFHLKNVYAKYGVSSRVELILKLRDSTGPADSERLGTSTVAPQRERAENADAPDARTGWAPTLRDAVSTIGRQMQMRSLFGTKHAFVAVITALLTGLAWVALLRRYGHVELQPIPWWLPALVVVLVLLGAFVGAVGRHNGSTLLRVFFSTLFGTGIGPFTVIPIVMVTVYPLGKLAESIGLVNGATMSRDLASNILIGSMLLIWLAVGATIGVLLLYISLRRPVRPNMQEQASEHSA